jgi:hypothetical protein
MKQLKNNMGILITLILVILLSQARFFNFLMDTHLGRLILITFVCLIAYSNKITGLVAVLFIIIAFNYNGINVVQSYNYNLYEGFDVSGNEDLKEKLNKIKEQREQNVNENTTLQNNNLPNINISSKISNPEGREGFCMSDRELNILRGKQSNSISVFNNSRDQTDNIMPSEKSNFSDLFSSF